MPTHPHPLHGRHPESPDPDAEATRSSEEYRDTSYLIEVVPSGDPVDTIDPPPGGSIPPVVGQVAYSAKRHLIPYAERGPWLVRRPWNHLRLAHEPHVLFDLDALSRTYCGRVQLGGGNEWVDGGLTWSLTLSHEQLPDRLPAAAWERFAQSLAAPIFRGKVAHAIDAKFARFLALFETRDGIPLGRHPELVVGRVREQLDLNRGATFAMPNNDPLLKRCTALARLEYEREEITNWLAAADGTAQQALGMAAGMNSAFVADSLESALAPTRGPAEPSFAVRDLLGRFTIDVVPESGSGRPGLTPAAVRVLQDLQQPLRENLTQLREAYGQHLELTRWQLRAERNDAKALRDCRLGMIKLVAKGVFHKHNAAAVLAQLGLGEVSELLSSMAEGAARDTDAGRD